MPRKLFMLIAISSMALVLSLAQWWFLVVTVFLLIVARRVSKEDRWVFDVYTQFLKLPSVLD
jgi:type IV secretory pathway VirB3-like protein